MFWLYILALEINSKEFFVKWPLKKTINLEGCDVVIFKWFHKLRLTVQCLVAFRYLLTILKASFVKILRDWRRSVLIVVFVITGGNYLLIICILNEMILCVKRRTQKKILSSRWELNPQPPVHLLDALTTFCHSIFKRFSGVVTKISRCQVNATWGMESNSWGFILVLFFFYFPMNIARGNPLSSASYWQPW